MMGVGEVIMLISLFAISVPAIERTLVHRWNTPTEVFEVALRRAFPFPPPSPGLDALTLQAEHALDQDDLSRGITATAATYDGASAGTADT